VEDFMRVERLFCARCGTDTPHELILPSRKKDGNEYVAVCSFCLSSSAVSVVEEDRSQYITFFCLSPRCQVRVRGKILREKNTQKDSYIHIIAACPFCAKEYEFIFKKHR
jgi:hypothetical protein